MSRAAESNGAVRVAQGQEQIEQVDQAAMNSGKPEDSFARLNYHPGVPDAARYCCSVQVWSCSR